MTKLKTVILAAVASGLPWIAAAPPAAAQGVGHRWEYAAKFVCGRVKGANGPVARGDYFTAINVHNPREPRDFKRKVAIALPGRPGPVTPFWIFPLKYDEAMEIDCAQIVLQLKEHGIDVPAFVKGFVVVQSWNQADVVAVYTAAPAGGQVASIHTERVPPRGQNEPAP
jgi:hypothetical protein